MAYTRTLHHLSKLVMCVLSSILITILVAEDLVQEFIAVISAFIEYVEPKTPVFNMPEVASDTRSGTPNSNATVMLGPSPTDSTESIVTPAETRPITDLSNEVVDVSSSKRTDQVNTVGSVKRCKEKIMAILNTMDTRNIQTKCNEIEIIVLETEDKCLPWLAQYIVNNFVSIESKHHKMYARFLNALNNEKLFEKITQETEKKIKALITQEYEDEGRVNPICRKTLTNLGRWYGMITLARNKPISTSFDDLKKLLIKAYQAGEHKLICILPLVLRILETSVNSTVFNNTNPWMVDVLNCLNELHRQTNIKLKFRFDIELLFKKLNLELQNYNHATEYFVENE